MIFINVNRRRGAIGFATIFACTGVVV